MVEGLCARGTPFAGRRGGGGTPASWSMGVVGMGCATRGRETTEREREARCATVRGKGGSASESGGVRAREGKPKREGRARRGRGARFAEKRGGKKVKDERRTGPNAGKRKTARAAAAREGGVDGRKKTDASAAWRDGARGNNTRRRTASTRSGVGVAEAVPTVSRAP